MKVVCYCLAMMDTCTYFLEMAVELGIDIGLLGML